MTEPASKRRWRSGGSLTRRMLALAALWVGVLLLIGGFALDKVLVSSLTRNFDAQLGYVLNAMVVSADLGPKGEVRFTRSLGDQRFLEPYSGLYWQVSARGQEPFPSRSLWDRRLTPDLGARRPEPFAYDSDEFGAESLRVVERDVILPGARTHFRFQVAESTATLDEQIAALRGTLVKFLGALGLGLLTLAALQATFGLWPLRRVRRAIAAIRSGAATRVPTDFPDELSPMVSELNALLDHNEKQAEASRMHAGNLAHALKTPMSVLVNEARSPGPELPAAVLAQTAVMRRHVDHHLARARAIGRRAAVGARTDVWPSLEALQRTIGRIHADRGIVIDIDGDKTATFRGERQDLEEMAGNLIDNAAKYGGGRVFVDVAQANGTISITVEDDGAGIPEASRDAIFGRGARLDTSKPGTGLGLAIVRDVAEIYEGSVTLGTSPDLGGLKVTLNLPAAR